MGNGLSLVQSYDDAYRMTAQTTTGVLERNYPDYDGNGNRLTTGDPLSANSSFTYDPLDRLNTASATSFAGDGDINANGQTNLGDLVLLYQFVTGSRIPTVQELIHADMNRDGELNAADLLEEPVRPKHSQLAHENTNPGALDWLISPAQALPGDVGDLYYVHSDPLGTPQVLTDESGAVVWTAQYDPFGEASVNEDPDSDGVVVTLNARLPGQYYDQETGLHYNYFRYYDPSTGRYITSDPIGLRGGPNTYAYVGGNPMRWFDTFGLRWETRGYDYHGISNWSRWLANRLGTLDEGKATSFQDCAGCTRDVLQEWIPHPDDPVNQRSYCTADDPAPGDTREIEQQFGEFPDPWNPNGESWHWEPPVPSPTYQNNFEGWYY